MGQAASAEDGFELQLQPRDHELQQDNRGNRLGPQSEGLGGRGPRCCYRRRWSGAKSNPERASGCVAISALTT
jgi:hypothetical protein